MNYFKKTVYFLFCWITLFACGNGNTESLKQTLKNEVMVVHDDAMAKMGMLYDLEIAVKNATDSTETESVEKASEVIAKLQTANKEMMHWMQQYKDPDFKDKDKLKQYFKSQMLSISKVKADTDSSILLANQFLEVHKKK